MRKHDFFGPFHSRRAERGETCGRKRSRTHVHRRDRNEIEKVAQEFGIEPAALLAVAEIESGGSVFAVIDGRQEPLIRFEGHYFDRRLSGEAQARARAEGLASPNAGEVANPASQAARWRLLATRRRRSTARRPTNPCPGGSGR